MATAPKNEAVDADGTVSIEFFARVYELNVERIRQLIKEGWIPRGPRGRVNFIQGIRGMDRYRQDQLKRSTERLGDTKIKDARAREIEMRIAQKTGALIEYGEALAICQTLFGALKAELDGLPAGVTRERELRHRIEDRINGALGRVVKRLEGWRETGRLIAD
jgi:hypothetical protein